MTWLGRVLARSRYGIRSQYVRSAPSAQTAVDLFRGEWISKLPPEAGDVEAGEVPLFEDPRVARCVAAVGGVEGRSCLELGPLEGGHTYMLERLGARSVTAVEANAGAFLRCLVTKEVLGLARSRFLLGDAVAFLRDGDARFDACLASGILYHLENPVEALALVARRCDDLMLWTHYFDAEAMRDRPDVLARFVGAERATSEGFAHTLHRQRYRYVTGFCGGSRPESCWMERDELVAALRHVGYARVEVLDDDRGHAGGPAMLVVATGAGITPGPGRT